VHGALSKLVAPATALTLRATEALPGKKSVLSRMPLIVQFAAVAAVISAIGFVVSSTALTRMTMEEKEAVTQEAAKQEAAKQKGSEQKKSEPAAGASPGPSTAAPAAAVKEGGAKP
jgi:mannitol-specific phosphotransferase system IIBC component